MTTCVVPRAYARGMTRLALLFMLSATACATSESAGDGGIDAARRDAGTPDASARDAGGADAAMDAGRVESDAGPSDAGARDAGSEAGERDAGTDSGNECACPRSVGCASEGDIVCAPAPEYPCMTADGWYAVCTPDGWQCRFTEPPLC
jgi:hypothetical protein